MPETSEWNIAGWDDAPLLCHMGRWHLFTRDFFNATFQSLHFVHLSNPNGTVCYLHDEWGQPVVASNCPTRGAENAEAAKMHDRTLKDIFGLEFA